jgi:hypothetical protein
MDLLDVPESFIKEEIKFLKKLTMYMFHRLLAMCMNTKYKHTTSVCQLCLKRDKRRKDTKIKTSCIQLMLTTYR